MNKIGPNSGQIISGDARPPYAPPKSGQMPPRAGAS
jgi:hypothetical protein